MAKAPKDTAHKTATDAVRNTIAKLTGRPAETAEDKTSKPNGSKRQKPGKK